MVVVVVVNVPGFQELLQFTSPKSNLEPMQRFCPTTSIKALMEHYNQFTS